MAWGENLLVERVEERVDDKVDEVRVNQDDGSFGNGCGVHKPVNLGSEVVLEDVDRWNKGQRIPGRIETTG